MGSTTDCVGNVKPIEAWEELKSVGGARLVDVRTTAEWAYVGLPDLSSIGKQPLLLEWQRFPEMTVDARFAVRLSRVLEESGVDPDQPVFFLCRSGARSLAAAQVMAKAGYTASYNVSDGFEGPADVHGHRGGIAGWKASGLPWRQS